MKKIGLISVILVISLIIVGCSKQSENYITNAVPFSKERMSGMKLTDVSYEYYAENVQAFEKSDGSKVIYLYSAPIERSENRIEEGNNGFQANGTYFNKVLPTNLSEETPIKVGNNTNFAKIFIPGALYEGKMTEYKNVFGINRPAVLYQDAFGEGNDYICYPTSFGVNTEIRISKKTKENKFQIKLQLPNLTPDIGSPDYILFKTALEKGEVKSLLYTPLVCDANGKWSYANAVKLIEKDSETNTYTVEYEVDKDFLNNKDTKFPVTLNQSIYLYKSKQPDTSAYENTQDEAGHYLSPYMLLGDRTLKGEGWTFIRYQTLNNLDIDPKKIVSAKYVFHNLFDLEEETKISGYAVTVDWCSINTRWFNRPTYDDKPISEVIVKKSGNYELDITPLFIEMVKNKNQENATYSVQNGFMIRSDTKNSNVIIASGDNGLYSPVLKIVLSE